MSDVTSVASVTVVVVAPWFLGCYLWLLLRRWRIKDRGGGSCLISRIATPRAELPDRFKSSISKNVKSTRIDSLEQEVLPRI